MVKKVKELVTYWGPAISEWGDGTEKRYEIDRDKDLLRNSGDGGRKMEKISLNDIFAEGVVTGVDMVNGYMPLVLYANMAPIMFHSSRGRGVRFWEPGLTQFLFKYNAAHTLRA